MTVKQRRLLQLLREIDGICRKYHLRYVMAGGSLIGVVRHEGFIPWDDDMDICMPKKDWDVLVSVAEKELPPHRAIQCLDVTRNYTNTFPRYADTSSCVIHRHQIIADDKAGEIIDVFTLDPIPDDDDSYVKYRTDMMVYSELAGVSTIYCARWEVPVTRYWKNLLSMKLRGKEKTLKKLEDRMFSYPEEECSRYAMRWGGCPFLFDKDMMFPVKYGKFEDLEVMIPARTSDYLIWHYGDEWSYIPGHDERTSHVMVGVEGVGYEEFRKEYMPGLDAKKIARDAIVRKSWQTMWARKDHRLLRQRLEVYGRCTAMELKALIKKEKADLKELAQKRQFDRLSGIFSRYYEAQCSRYFIGREDFSSIYQFYHPVLIQLEDEIFYAAVLTLFYTERVAMTWRLLQVKEQEDRITEKEKELRGDITAFRKCTALYEAGELERSRALCDQLLEKYPDHPGLMKLRCRFFMERAREGAQYARAGEFLDKARRIFPNDSYFLKYQGDLLWMQGRREEAFQIYAEVRKYPVVNGIVQLEMEKLLQEEKKKDIPAAEQFFARGNAAEARKILERWKELLPEDSWVEVLECCLGVYEASRDFPTLEREILSRLSVFSEEEKEVPERRLLWQALVRMGKNLGLEESQAELYGEISLENKDWNARELLGKAEGVEDAGIRQMLAGQIYFRMGDTDSAFARYQEALTHPLPKPARERLVLLILRDWYHGGRKLSSFAGKKDAGPYLDHWLGKYESVEHIQKLAAEFARG